MIYEHVLGFEGRKVHIIGMTRNLPPHELYKAQRHDYLKIATLECFERCEEGCWHDVIGKCWGCGTFDMDSRLARKKGTRGTRVEFLRSCRKM